LEETNKSKKVFSCGCNEVEKGSTGGVEQGPEREKEEEEAASPIQRVEDE